MQKILKRCLVFSGYPYVSKSSPDHRGLLSFRTIRWKGKTLRTSLSRETPRWGDLEAMMVMVADHMESWWKLSNLKPLRKNTQTQAHFSFCVSVSWSLPNGARGVPLFGITLKWCQVMILFLSRLYPSERKQLLLFSAWRPVSVGSRKRGNETKGPLNQCCFGKAQISFPLLNFFGCAAVQECTGYFVYFFL